TIMMNEPTPGSEVAANYLTQALQVAQTRQALLGNEVNLINLRNQYLASLDTFKVGELYLPPQICIEPSDPLLTPFDLIDQEIIRLPEDWEAVLLKNVDVRRTIPERIQSNVQVAAGPPPTCRLNRYEGLEADLVQLRTAFAEMQQFAKEIASRHLPTI